MRLRRSPRSRGTRRRSRTLVMFSRHATVLHHCTLELKLWPSVATREQQQASLLASFSAAATEGPCGFMKHRGQKAKVTEEFFLWAQLVAGKATIPQEWVDSLPVDRLLAPLQRIVRHTETREYVAARNAARAARWEQGRSGGGAAAAAAAEKASSSGEDDLSAPDDQSATDDSSVVTPSCMGESWGRRKFCCWGWVADAGAPALYKSKGGRVQPSRVVVQQGA
eukprot:gene11761-biopygen358